MSIYRDQLMDMVSSWTKEQLTAYIERLEKRVEETNNLLRELRAIRKRMSTKAKDTGDRHQ